MPGISARWPSARACCGKRQTQCKRSCRCCVRRWSGAPERVVRDIHALGDGLTLGLPTRIDGRAEGLALPARVGKVYVNRGLTGAVVGVRCLGGEGLSGTGPKAGGPRYLPRYLPFLPRFCSEQTLTINTAAAGSNIDLLAR